MNSNLEARKKATEGFSFAESEHFDTLLIGILSSSVEPEIFLDAVKFAAKIMQRSENDQAKQAGPA